MLMIAGLGGGFALLVKWMVNLIVKVCLAALCFAFLHRGIILLSFKAMALFLTCYLE